MQDTIVTLSSCLMLVCCHMPIDCSNVNQEASKQQGKRTTISFALEADGKSANASGKKYALVIKNTGPDDILLDRRLLNPVVFVQITDEHGSIIPKIPPSVPIPFSDKEVFVIRPGKVAKVDFGVSDVTMEHLNGKKYGVMCQYDSSDLDYPASIKMWKGIGKTDRLYFLAN